MIDAINFISNRLKKKRRRVHCETQQVALPIICCIKEPLDIPIKPLNT